MKKLWLYDGKYRTEKITPPGEKEDIALNMTIIPGIHSFKDCEILHCFADRSNKIHVCVGMVYEAKHMVFSDLARYNKLCSFFYNEKANTYHAIEYQLKHHMYPTFITGEIVTVLFFTIQELNK